MLDNPSQAVRIVCVLDGPVQHRRTTEMIRLAKYFSSYAWDFIKKAPNDQPENNE
uniref:Uncharacterized protein n=1 Tax=Rhizophora mucronata TaxID=61149 RepID=A0A2P2N6D8_RHIMU